ncbi:N-acetylmuramoyl-L-alanine amidase [Mesorhizobium sp. M1329]|uniref:N-acetylmuramoyl-L-alanine amidase n=1 Tax=Mesorhizobium sp. M1329 TaxID=2957083 RepID=UPI0033389188
MRPIDTLVWHCAATPEGKWFDVEDVRKWHTLPPPKGRGWKDVGYHFIVLLDGTIQKGRPLDRVGAHVEGHNTGSIGCCYIGGIEANSLKPKDTRTAAQKAAMLKLTQDLLKQFPTIKRIAGHNEYASKACPSFDVRKDPLGNLPTFTSGRRP